MLYFVYKIYFLGIFHRPRMDAINLFMQNNEEKISEKTSHFFPFRFFGIFRPICVTLHHKNMHKITQKCQL